MEGKRPGGLTALAVINFILAVVIGTCLGAGVGAFALLDAGVIPAEHLSQEDKDEMAKARQIMDDPAVKTLTVLGLVPIVLLVVSGIGYLKQKRVLGRIVGNVYAIVSILLSGAELVFASGVTSFGLMSLIELIYPILTLVLLNLTFKHDFVN